jgi:hypothetical protein
LARPAWYAVTIASPFLTTRLPTRRRTPTYQFLRVTLEGLCIALSNEVSALDLGPEELDQFQVVEPDAPLRHAQDRMLCRIQGAHGVFP